MPVKGRLPVRADVDPFEPVRAIEGADCCESVRGRGPEVSIASYLLLDQYLRESQRGSYRGDMTGHGASSGGHGSGNIASTTLVFVDGGPVVWRVVCWWKEGSNPSLDLCLLKKKLLKFVSVGRGIHCHGGGLLGGC